jgi:tetratricopeptide (TPR) repeat protein
VPLLNALVEQGDLEGAELALASADVPRRLPEQLGWALVLEARGRLRLAQSKPEEALEDLLEAGRRWERCQWSHPGLMAWRNAAAPALGQLSERDEAARLAAEQLELAQPTELPRPVGAAALAAALVAPSPESLPLVHEAVSALERTPARLESAHALVALGAALRREGKRIAAREHLRRGLELAHRAGARPLAARAHEELVAAGARPRRPVFTGSRLDGERASRCPPRHRGSHQPGGRRAVLRHRPDRRDTPTPRFSEARRPGTERAARPAADR